MFENINIITKCNFDVKDAVDYTSQNTVLKSPTQHLTAQVYIKSAVSGRVALIH